MNVAFHLLFAAILLPAAARSESPRPNWAEKIVSSDNHKYLCHVVPRGVFPGLLGPPAPKAYATFYFSEDASPEKPASYLMLWRRELPNSVAPLRTRISSDGQFVVMIGDYDAPTSGRIIIYSGMADTSIGSGQLLANTSIKEVLTAKELALVPPVEDPHDFKGPWSAPHRIDATTKTLILQVVSGGTAHKPEYSEVRLDLRTGKRLH